MSDCLVGKRRQEHRQILVVKPAGQACSDADILDFGN